MCKECLHYRWINDVKNALKIALPSLHAIVEGVGADGK
ncbi:hypothetical protein AC77_5330 [Escherichia coli 5-366-08_S4_C1]|nr:hypothetical protein AC77_5330 [Escherichia coli 5-366-08_S4_C1]